MTSKTKQSAVAFAAAMLEEFSARDDVQTKRITVKSIDGIYEFIFADHEFPDASADDAYDVDIDIIGSRYKQADILAMTAKGFTFSLMSKGKHFAPVPINCADDPTTVNIQCTYTDGFNEDSE